MIQLSALFGDEANVLEETDYQLLLLMNLFPPLGTALVSPVLDSLIEPLGSTPSDIGLVMSLFTGPAVIMIPLAGALADRVGRKPILIAGLIVFGLAGSAIAFTTDFTLVLTLRAVQGIGFAALTPIIITSIGDLYDGSKETTAQGLRFTGSGVTQVVFPLLAGSLVTIAWNYPFFLYAITLPIAILVYLWFDEPTDGIETAQAATDSSTVTPGLRSLYQLLRQRRVAGMIIARTLPIVVWIAFLTYNSIIVIQIIGGTPMEAGLLVALGSLTYAGSASQAGRLLNLFGNWFHLLVGTHVFLGVGFVILIFAPSFPIAGLAVIISGIGFGITLSLYRSLITGFAPQTLRGGLVSIAEAGGRLSATVTPILMGAVIEYATPTFGFVGALQVAGIGAGIVTGVGGIVVLAVAWTAPEVTHPLYD